MYNEDEKRENKGEKITIQKIPFAPYSINFPFIYYKDNEM